MLTPRKAQAIHGIDYRTLVDGARRGVLRCTWAPTKHGKQQPLFDARELAEDLVRCPCSFPGCDLPAPGKSGRCFHHGAGVKYPTELRRCENCWDEFTICGSTLRQSQYGERGKRCPNCRGRVQNLHGAGNTIARERFDELEPLFAAEQARLRLPLLAADVAQQLRTGASAVKMAATAIGASVVEIDGAKRLAFPEDAAKRFRELTLNDGHRERWIDVEHYVAQQTPLLSRRLGVDASVAATVARANGEARRRAIRGRGPKPRNGPTPIEEIRADFIARARQALDSDVSDRQVFLAAIQLIGVERPDALPAHYFNHGELVAVHEQAALVLMWRAAKAAANGA